LGWIVVTVPDKAWTLACAMAIELAREKQVANTTALDSSFMMELLSFCPVLQIVRPARFRAMPRNQFYIRTP
jgi:hypothetical protein